MPSRSNTVIAVMNVPPFGKSTLTVLPSRSDIFWIVFAATTCISSL
jgi:hypothetical protein